MPDQSALTVWTFESAPAGTSRSRRPAPNLDASVLGTRCPVPTGELGEHLHCLSGSCKPDFFAPFGDQAVPTGTSERPTFTYIHIRRLNTVASVAVVISGASSPGKPVV